MTSLSFEQIRRILDNPKFAPPSAKFLGLEVIDFSLEDRWCEFAFAPRVEMANPAGHVQGGFVAAMLDDAMGLCATIATRMEAIVPTLQLNVTFMEPTPMARVLARAEVLRLGRNTAQMQSSLTRVDGLRLATATASAVIRPIPEAMKRAGGGPA